MTCFQCWPEHLAWSTCCRERHNKKEHPKTENLQELMEGVNIKNWWKESIERFCIPFYGIFKTESLSDRVRVRPAASRRWLSTKTVLHFVRRFGGFVWRFRGSGRAIVLSRSRWISSLLIFWPRTRTEIWTKKNVFFFSHAEWKTLQLVSLPQFQFALISWMKRPVFDVFDCSFIPDCFLLEFSLFLCCLVRIN